MQKQIQFFVMLVIASMLVSCGRAPENEAITKPPSKAAQVNPDYQPKPTGGIYQLVMLGDSLTAGLGLAAADAFPRIIEADLDARDGQHIAVLNAGVSGDTSASGLARFDWSVGPEADGVFIALGANDMLNGLDPAQTRKNLAAMIEKARLRRLDVFLAGMRAAPNLGVKYGQDFDELYENLSNAHCVPLFAFLMQPLANDDGTAIDQKLIQIDGLHPTKAGAALIGHALSDWLDTELESPHIPCRRGP